VSTALKGVVADRLFPYQGSLFPAEEGVQEIGFISWCNLLLSLPHSEGGADRVLPAGVTIGGAQGRPLPYGRYPRLIIIYLCTEAIKSNSPRVELGATVSSFAHRLEITPTTGPRGSVRQLKEQLGRMKDLYYSLEVNRGRSNRIQDTASVNFFFLSSSHLWWDEGSGPSWVQLSPDFFNSLKERPIPLRFDLVRAERKSVGMDLLIWLSYVGHLVASRQEPFSISWKVLEIQFASSYAERRHFKRFFLEALKGVVEQHYPKGRFESSREGLRIFSMPSRVLALR
jgi:hypothetical protein